MRANFTGPSFTVGIEEELMIVDAASLSLVNAIELLLEDTGAANVEREDGDIKPELMESVLEIATKPCRTTIDAGDQLRSAAPPGARDRRQSRPGRSAPPARTRSRCGRTSGSSRARATAT